MHFWRCSMMFTLTRKAHLEELHVQYWSNLMSDWCLWKLNLFMPTLRRLHFVDVEYTHLEEEQKLDDTIKKYGATLRVYVEHKGWSEKECDWPELDNVKNVFESEVISFEAERQATLPADWQRPRVKYGRRPEHFIPYDRALKMHKAAFELAQEEGYSSTDLSSEQYSDDSSDEEDYEID